MGLPPSLPSAATTADRPTVCRRRQSGVTTWILLLLLPRFVVRLRGCLQLGPWWRTHSGLWTHRIMAVTGPLSMGVPWLSPPPWRPRTSQQLSASERYPPALLLSFPLSFWCAQGRNDSVELRCRSPRQLLRSFQRADGFPDPWPVFITRPRCSCHPQPVVYPHPSRPLFLPVEAVVSWVR